MLPSLSGLVPTGVGESIPPEVATNPDLMVQILTALSAGDSEEACKMAMGWCASHRGACSDALWHDLRMRIFPQTRGVPWPLYAHNEKHWFYMLCHGLEAALEKQAEAAVNLSLAEKTPHSVPTWVGRGTNRDGSRRWIRAIRGKERDLQFEFDLADLQLQVILSGRYRKGLAYTKGNVWKPRAGVAPHFSSRAGVMVLTWEEMEAQLDRLDGKTDEDDAGVDGDDNM
ncbi:MAG: hypothetical protein CMB11_09555 [Euryarchaeota archaeon]|nr:hypothetical protein [Euryarchaeota archaeon]